MGEHVITLTGDELHVETVFVTVTRDEDGFHRVSVATLPEDPGVSLHFMGKEVASTAPVGEALVRHRAARAAEREANSAIAQVRAELSGNESIDEVIARALEVATRAPLRTLDRVSPAEATLQPDREEQT